LLSYAAAGVWTASKMDSRIAALEEDAVWKAAVTHRLDRNDMRWAHHFNLWGDAIARAEAEREARN
jgi:hypothetical protein